MTIPAQFTRTGPNLAKSILKTVWWYYQTAGIAMTADVQNWICNTCKFTFEKSDVPNKSCPQCGGTSISKKAGMISGGHGTGT
jgi:rubrerythrin